MSVHNSPLGQEAGYPQTYAPEALYPIARIDARNDAGIGYSLPFDGVDIWNAWELSWLNDNGVPQAATLELRVPADSPNLVESKSLKLYLGSFAMSTFADRADVQEAIETDLSAAAGAPVVVTFDCDAAIAELPGSCIDSIATQCDAYHVNPDLLDANPEDVVKECLHTHLLRSLCPVTGQPDLGSLQVCYSGPRIDPAALLRYVVSFREHNDFHEACVERIFVDILERCCPQELTVAARYQRRGGIDINPFRTNAGNKPENRRLWRQ
ncbi:MAG: NADPH-dependent 7-cyano-7-deazaguanine reductase QueF [Pseudomonadota bacterium]